MYGEWEQYFSERDTLLVDVRTLKLNFPIIFANSELTIEVIHLHYFYLFSVFLTFSGMDIHLKPPCSSLYFLACLVQIDSI